ncbi:MAG: hypothetical protein JO170_25695 [Verrucomicrobia bacterium]|nr:hypothetical protein [Verrucomicrobiota bacterium]
MALVRYVDEKRGLPQEIQKIADAPNGVAALTEMAALQARTNPGVWAMARAFDAVRRTDKAVEQSWQDRLEDRLKGCREVVARLQNEGTLRPGPDPTGRCRSPLDYAHRCALGKTLSYKEDGVLNNGKGTNEPEPSGSGLPLTRRCRWQ